MDCLHEHCVKFLINCLLFLQLTVLLDEVRRANAIRHLDHILDDLCIVGVEPDHRREIFFLHLEVRVEEKVDLYVLLVEASEELIVSSWVGLGVLVVVLFKDFGVVVLRQFADQLTHDAKVTCV